MIIQVKKSETQASAIDRARWLSGVAATNSVSTKKVIEWLDIIDSGGRINIPIDGALAQTIASLGVNTDLFDVTVIGDEDDDSVFDESIFNAFHLMRQGANGDPQSAVEFCSMVRNGEVSLLNLNLK